MTIVVWRNGLMAADGLINADGDMFSDKTTKIAKNASGWVGGAAGDWSAVLRYLEWIKKDCRGKPKFGEDFAGLLVSPRGKLFYLDSETRVELSEEFFAIGSGSRHAIGALEMGADARRAVEVACKYVTSCGGTVTTIETGRRVRRSVKHLGSE
jgi:hypothetical protein